MGKGGGACWTEGGRRGGKGELELEGGSLRIQEGGGTKEEEGGENAWRTKMEEEEEEGDISKQQMNSVPLSL